MKSKDIGLAIEIEEKLINEISDIGKMHFPNEFGGILIGRYSNDNKVCYIEKTLIPLKFKSTNFYFERGQEGLREKLTEVFNGNPRLIYVGEWHTHPNGIPIPSKTDYIAMKEIAYDSNVYIRNPILLIFGIDLINMKMGAFVFSNDKLEKYE